MPIHFKEISITFEKTYNAKLSHTNSNHPQSPPRFAWSNFPFSVYHSLPHPPPVHYPPDKVQSYRCNPNRKSFERMIFNISEVCGMRIVPNRVGKKKVDLGSNYIYRLLPSWTVNTRIWGPFLERPGKLTGPVSYVEIEVSRKVGCLLTYNEVHFVSLAENFTVNFQKFWNSHLEWKTKQLNGPGNYRELRETGPRLFISNKFTSSALAGRLFSVFTSPWSKLQIVTI